MGLAASDHSSGNASSGRDHAVPEQPPVEAEPESLGQRVRALRKKQKLSLNDLSRLSGVSKGYLSQVERSLTVRPSAITIFSIAEALGTTVGVLFDGLNYASDLAGQAGSGGELPDSLREFAAEADLPPTDVSMLAGIRYRGAQPRDKEDWRFLYESIRRSIRGPDRSTSG
ncbi:MAG: helix-turn-helix transcriptional regulator [Chloroflexota bacterium]|nr:helix-turn-helix transcriptional regulator [Chloroflexota bacterium]